MSIADLWPEEVEDKYCDNYMKPATNDTENQQTCQELCEENNACIGMSYSYKESQTNWCYICLDDNLSTATDNVAFYRKPRPGKALHYKPWYPK